MGAAADTEFDDEQHDNAYPPGIEALYWHRARNRIVHRKLGRHLGVTDSVLEVGCGSGVVVAYLRAQGIACEGVDLALRANVVPGAEGHVQYGVDAFDLAPHRRASTTVLLLLDVLEHLRQPGEFLEKCDKAFPSAHHLFVTLPARPEVWSSYDDYYAHYARYTLESLSDLAVPRAFRLCDSGYFFHALYWAARAQQLVSTSRSVRAHAPSFRRLHDVVGRAFDWEERIAPRTTRGLSLYATYERDRA